MKGFTRRRFMKSSLAVGAAAAIAPYSRVLGANNDVRVAVVGFRNHANGYLSRNYRKPFIVPEDV